LSELFYAALHTAVLLTAPAELGHVGLGFA